ncbi:uncharacterized protein LOC133527772 [Cydia pomonella]|uniref:uncharacterized protein LOC133527772 n=1 Tax=Cydia pomonella TaxID=82600 RepID=UPI002ADDE792|nr:uncharacterized protein LOC133527772 [Cydia pomonella]XP_061720921.1 uncharacterized protein LOC133527772 [Cydia pomonella]
MDKTSEFTEYKLPNESDNSAWKHFLRSVDGLKAKCKMCAKILKNSRSTTPLHNHLKLHGVNLKKSSENATASTSTTSQSQRTISTGETSESEAAEPPKKKTKLTHFFKIEDCMEVHVSKLAALDGLSFNVICTSITIRKLFLKSGYSLPKSPHTIKRIIVSQSAELKLALKQQLNKMKIEGSSFSVSLDEWTSSSQNTRYMNLNLHSPKLPSEGYKNLGLLQIKNKGTAENLYNMLEKQLNDFDLQLSDIVCIISDGAKVMCALGRRTTGFHQLCLAHGIQLAIFDVLYKKNTTATPAAETYSGSDVEASTTIDDSEGDSDFDREYSIEIEEEEGLCIEQTRPSPMQLVDNYKTLINKVRSVVKLLKKSPTKSDILYRNAEDEKKNVHLILDCKTRWSSLADMVTRFILLKQSILKSLIDIKSQITFSEDEFQQLNEIADSLNMIKTTVESICQRDANLLTAEIAMKFMIQKLSENHNQLSMKLVKALKERIAERRLSDVSGTLKYLHNPTNFYREGLGEYPFENPMNDRVKEIIIKLNSRQTQHQEITELQSPEPDNTETEPIPGTSTGSTAMPSNYTIKDQLQAEINRALSAGASTSSQETSDLDLNTKINVEMALYDSGGQRSDSLERAYNSLRTIPPTSVEAERVFSAAGYLCNHLRSKMKEDSIDALSFLRSHYQAQK